jgi:hypothetical protein
MRRKGIGEDSAGPDERNTRKEEGEAPQLAAKNRPLPRSYRELGEGIFRRHHPEDVGSEVIEKGNPATKLQTLKTCAAWVFGNSDAEMPRNPPRIIWDIPGPPYEPPCEPLDPELLAAGALEEEKLEGGEK